MSNDTISMTNVRASSSPNWTVKSINEDLHNMIFNFIGILLMVLLLVSSVSDGGILNKIALITIVLIAIRHVANVQSMKGGTTATKNTRSTSECITSATQMQLESAPAQIGSNNNVSTAPKPPFVKAPLESDLGPLMVGRCGFSATGVSIARRLSALDIVDGTSAIDTAPRRGFIRHPLDDNFRALMTGRRGSPSAVVALLNDLSNVNDDEEREIVLDGDQDSAETPAPLISTTSSAPELSSSSIPTPGSHDEEPVTEVTLQRFSEKGEAAQQAALNPLADKVLQIHLRQTPWPRSSAFDIVPWLLPLPSASPAASPFAVAEVTHPQSEEIGTQLADESDKDEVNNDENEEDENEEDDEPEIITWNPSYKLAPPHCRMAPSQQQALVETAKSAASSKLDRTLLDYGEQEGNSSPAESSVECMADGNTLASRIREAPHSLSGSQERSGDDCPPPAPAAHGRQDLLDQNERDRIAEPLTPPVTPPTTPLNQAVARIFDETWVQATPFAEPPSPLEERADIEIGMSLKPRTNRAEVIFTVASWPKTFRSIVQWFDHYKWQDWWQYPTRRELDCRRLIQADRERRLKWAIDPDNILLGAGAFGTVVGTQNPVNAVKSVRTGWTADDQYDSRRWFKRVVDARASLQKEITAAGKVRHPNILRHDSYWYDPSGMNIFLSFPRMDYALDTWVFDKCGKLSGEQLKSLMTCLFGALEACHEKNLCHLDVKPENILVKVEETAAENEDCVLSFHLADFGCAQESDGFQYVECGTTAYMSPEAVEAYKTVCQVMPSQDIWAAAVTIMELLNDQIAHTALTDNCVERTARIIEAAYEQPAWSVWKDLLRFDPVSRMTAAEAYAMAADMDTFETATRFSSA